jgi:hypothetical protein
MSLPQQKNNDLIKTKNGQEIEKAPTVTPQAEDLKVLTPQEVGALQVMNRKTPNDVFEKLEQGYRLRENFNKFKEKLDVCENFASGYNNEALAMTIQNLGTGEEINIQSIPMILEFVNDRVIKAGRNHLKNLEEEIVNFTL